MAQSHIEWREMTWNPTTGCTKISAGCKNCDAEIMSKRLQAMGVEKYRTGFKLTLQPEALEIPYEWHKPKLVFVNSMSDLFHEDIPLKYIQKVFQVMNDCSQHTFQILTKRADVLSEYDKHLSWSPNICTGVSVENVETTWRIDELRKTSACTKFLSLEPLLGPLSYLNLKKIDWVIVGGENGPKARPMKKEWIIEIKKQCLQNEVPFFFKQWGGKNKKANGRILNGKTYDEMPRREIKMAA
jgi:protein gp37